MSVVAAGIGGAVSLGIAGYGHYKAGKDKKAAQAKMDSLQKPKYEIPEELKKNLSEAESRAVEGLPAEQKAEFVKNLDRNSAANLKASTDRKSGLMGLQAQTSAANDASLNLVSMDAAAKRASEQQKRNDILNARGVIAGAKDKAFGIQDSNYQSQLQSAQGNYQAAGQTQDNALQSMGQTVIGLAGTAGGAALANRGGGAGNMAGGIGSAPAASGPQTVTASSGGLSTPGTDWGNYFK